MTSSSISQNGIAARLRRGIERVNLHAVLFIAVLLLGIFARAWEFGSLPPGLNQDEAASGVDAYSLLHYGIDRNGVSYPVYFISYGSGQSAADIYLLMPFIALGGLTPFMVRLPVLITGILTLPLTYAIGRRVIDRTFGLMAMFVLAIAPWHIIMSRWGHESNLLPFFFALGFYLLIKSTDDNRWFIPAMVLMAICLYVYGPAYAAVPIFLAIALPILLFTRSVRLPYLLGGLAAFLLVAFPIALFMLVNYRRWDTLHIGAVTIPRLPTKPRYEVVSILFRDGLRQSLSKQVQTLASMLWSQTDHHPYNVVEPFGYLYPYTLPFAALGSVALILRRGEPKWLGRVLLLAWLMTGLLVGVLQPANFNRANLLFLPLTFCLAAVLTWAVSRSRVMAGVAVVVLLAAFALFTRAYHGEAYRAGVAREFFSGILPGIDYASRTEAGPVCITDKISEPHIYVLFSQKMNPADYLPTVKYANPRATFRTALHLDRYSFGLEACPNEPRTVYVLLDEKPPLSSVRYKTVPFELFTVYVPEGASN